MSKVILAIDDSLSFRQVVSLTLEEAGYTVIEASDGQEGYEKATSETLHGIITDLNMPKLNGIEFIKKYRSHPSSTGIPVVFLSTETNQDLKNEAMQAGATGWIAKPFTEEQLLETVKKVIG